MRATIPILTCDGAGCPEWTPDWYTMGHPDWLDLMAGWAYEPSDGGYPVACPAHVRGVLSGL